MIEATNSHSKLGIIALGLAIISVLLVTIHTTGAATPTNTNATFKPQPLQSPAYPDQRWGGGMVYDEASGYYLLFGGSDGLADTWTFSNGTWTEINTTTAPSARTNFCMAYDQRTDDVVLFGGAIGGNTTSKYLNDTWIYSNGTWTNITSQAGPIPPMMYVSCTYDSGPDTGYLLMFGGYILNGNMINQNGNETWIFAKNKWTELFPANSPTGRFAPSMAYDAQDKYVVLYGGENCTIRCTYLNDTWIYSEGNWSMVTDIGPTPPGRWEASMLRYSTGVVLFGGQINNLKNNGTTLDHSAQNQTWQFINGTWNNITPISPLLSPGTRFDAAMAYDPTTKTILLFSGLSATAVHSPLRDDTWSYTKGKWTSVTNNISFMETGLSAGAKWSVTLTKDSTGSFSNSTIFNRLNGDYAYVISKVPGYIVVPSTGIVYVNDSSPTINVLYVPTNESQGK